MQNQDTRAVIATRLKRLGAALAAGDAAGLADFYTQNGMLLPSGYDLVEGRQAIAAFWRDAMDQGIADIVFDTVEVEHDGDTIVEISRFAMSGADGEVIERGKGLAVWKVEDGTWKVHRDIWNTNLAQR